MPECEKWLQCAGLDSNRHVLELLTECQSIGLSRLQSEQATTIACESRVSAKCSQSEKPTQSGGCHLYVGRYHRLALIAKICTDIYGVRDELGTIEVGKLADLIVVGGNPLEDIQNVRRLQLVVKEGIACPTNANDESGWTTVVVS
jgi:hypothetical protein